MRVDRQDTADLVKLDISMSVDEWGNLLVLLGQLAAKARASDDDRLFWQTMRLVNELNTGNPRFTPFELPEGV